MGCRCATAGRLRGADAFKLARILTPRNIADLEIGSGKYIPMCDFNGVIINDPVLLQIEKEEIWLSIADSDILLWASAIAGMSQFDVKVFEPDVSPLAVQGPKAKHVITDLFGSWINDLKYFDFQNTELRGIPVIVARSGWSKEGGYELYLRDGSKADELWSLVASAGARYKIGPGTPNYIARLEGGLISYGADTDDHTNPFELGLDKFIDLDQDTDFIGKSALQEIKRRGVNRRFVGLIIEGERFEKTNEHRWDVLLNGEYVGYSSACAYSPRLRSNIGVGLISTAAIEAPDGMVVVTDYGALAARAVSFPMV